MAWARSPLLGTFGNEALPVLAAAVFAHRMVGLGGDGLAAFGETGWCWWTAAAE